MAHVTLAASEKAAQDIFGAVRDNFHFAKSDSANFGPFSAGYDLAIRLENGSLDFRADNTVKIDELDIKWEHFNFFLDIDIPEWCIGGFCIIPKPWGGCFLRAPKFCVFSGNPDIHLPINLDNLLTSEVSLTGSLLTRYRIDPLRPATMDDWEAQETIPPLFNKWQIFLDPQTMDIDPIDVADTVGDLIENIGDAIVDNLLGWLPGWAKDIIKAIIGGIADVLRAVLDIADDIQEWISDLLNVSFGILDFIATAIADYFANKYPLFEFEDPYPILDKAPNPNPGFPPQLIPVKIPLRDFRVFNTDAEMVVETNIG